MNTDRRRFLAGATAACGLWPVSGNARPPNTPDITWVSGSDPVVPSGVYNLATAQTPKFRALCRTETGVAQAIDWARREGMSFSVQSGGHCFAGLSQNEHLIIDLRLFDRVTASGTDLRAGSGARLRDINRQTETHGRALPAGYCQHVALGGHVGGGGLGVLSRTFGLACDQLISARMVMADGTIRDITQSGSPDLFWALQGGGSGSFGIVTEWHLRTHAVEAAHFAEVFWLLPAADAAQVASRWQHICAGMDRGISSFLYFGAHAGGRLRLQLRLVSVAEKARTRQVLDNFAGLQPTLVEPELRSGTYLAIANAMWPPDYNPQEWIRTKTRFLPDSMPADQWRHLFQLVTDAGKPGPVGSVQQLGGALADHSPTATAYPHRHASFLAQLGVTKDPDDPEPVRTDLLWDAAQVLDDVGAFGAYINYPEPQRTDWALNYWADNLSRLQITKMRFDPDNLFHHAQSVPLP